MSTTPNTDISSISYVREAAYFVLLVFAAAVIITTGFIALDVFFKG